MMTITPKSQFHEVLRNVKRFWLKLEAHIAFQLDKENKFPHIKVN